MRTAHFGKKKIALLATTNAFRINAPTKYLVFRYVVERTDIIPPNPTHRKIRFGPFIISVRQRKKSRNVIKIENTFNIVLFFHFLPTHCAVKAMLFVF